MSTAAERRAADAIAADVDASFCEGRFADIDAKLPGLDPVALGPLLSLVWLSNSWHARPHLHHLDAYRDRVAAFFRETMPDRAEALLRGFTEASTSC